MCPYFVFADPALHSKVSQLGDRGSWYWNQSCSLFALQVNLWLPRVVLEGYSYMNVNPLMDVNPCLFNVDGPFELIFIANMDVDQFLLII